jgi:hypothetical protein
MYCYVLLNGNVTHVFRGRQCWLSKGLAESVVGTEQLLGGRGLFNGGCEWPVGV